LELLIERFLSVAVFVPIGRRGLESNKAPALRAPLAAPFKFVNAFCKPEEKLPPPAAIAKEHLSPNSPARSDKRACLRTVEVEPELETPQHRPPKAATLLRSQNDRAYLNRPASGVRSVGDSSDSSQRRLPGTKTVTDKNPELLATDYSLMRN
jgi:hypothetical protein